MSIHEILKTYWGYTSFRPLQEDIINSVLQGNDTFALLPTGGGKSLCYQIPAIASDGICLVVSPLIALMKDQVNQLRQRGIAASYLVSGMNHYEIELVLNNCTYGNTKLLYVSPERLKSRVFIDHCKLMHLSLIAVDEAHCISQWGYDFRPPYLEIARIRDFHPKTPVIALTATATTEVVNDIQNKLQFKHPRVFTQSFFRPNIAYMVLREDDKQGRLLRIIRQVGGSGIIYVRNRRRSQDVARFLSANGIAAEAFHAGISQQERDTKQTLWTKSDHTVMVATNAFGMGIDKPNVRFVVHLDIPESPESYFQEAGRAGRDGEKAYAVLLFNENDIEQLNYNIEQDFPPLQTIRNIYRGICNFYQIPIGAGADQSYDFDITTLCHNYNFSPIVFFSATRFLEREGLIELPTRAETQSQLFVPISKEDFYRYEVENKRFGDLLGILLRMYGGLFTDFVPIDEREIARRYYSQEDIVVTMLKKLNDDNIVSYKQKSSHPQINFLSPRIDANDLQISPEHYDMLKARAIQRKDAMVDYVQHTDKCRSIMLSAYFGDVVTQNCGICDVCLSKHSEPITDITNRIKAALAVHPLTIKDLVCEVGGTNEERIVECVRNLIDIGTISVDVDFYLHWK